MKVSGFCVLFLMLATSLMFLSFSEDNTGYSFPDVVFKHSDASTIMATSRKLKENGYNPSTNKKQDMGGVNLEDYLPINPVPSSKASLKPGPIEHGSPVIPYIPKPSPPPRYLKNDGST